MAAPPDDRPPLIQPFSLKPPPPSPTPGERLPATEHDTNVYRKAKVYAEAEASIEGSRIMHAKALRDPSHENLGFERHAAQRTRNAVERLWQEPDLATAMAASGSTPDSMKSDLDAQRYDRVAFFVDKARPYPPSNIDPSRMQNVVKRQFPIPATDPNPELAMAARSQPSSQEESRQGESPAEKANPVKPVPVRADQPVGPIAADTLPPSSGRYAVFADGHWVTGQVHVGEGEFGKKAAILTATDGQNYIARWDAMVELKPNEAAPTKPPPWAAPIRPNADDPATPAPAAKAEPAEKPNSPAQPAAAANDPMRKLLDVMEHMKVIFANADPALAKTLQDLSRRGADPDQRAQPGFRNDAAYALQDLEKRLGTRLELPTALRAELTRLAGTAVGLTNERMQALMQATGAIEDRRLVGEIRELAKDIGLLADQNTKEVHSRIDVVENRVRLAERVPGPDRTAQAAASRGPASAERPPDAPRDNPDSGAVSSPGAARANGTPAAGPYQNGNPNQSGVTIQHSVLDTLLRAMRPDGRQPQPPWEPPATPVADRIAAHEQRVQRESDDRTFALAQQRAKTALDALQGFTNNEGAVVMNRIREAAKTEPGGMPQVLAEMRDGGRFADLRQQFANAMSDNAGFAAAYDKAAGALAAYGKTRTNIEPIIDRRPDATAFTQRLAEMDAEIGKAAASTPSKTEGRSMIEDLTKQAAELLQRAVDAVRAAFSRSPSANASASPAPSPGP